MGELTVVYLLYSTTYSTQATAFADACKRVGTRFTAAAEKVKLIDSHTAAETVSFSSLFQTGQKRHRHLATVSPVEALSIFQS
jgi:hypothetical protein